MGDLLRIPKLEWRVCFETCDLFLQVGPLSQDHRQRKMNADLKFEMPPQRKRVSSIFPVHVFAF